MFMRLEILMGCVVPVMCDADFADLRQVLIDLRTIALHCDHGLYFDRSL